MVASMLLRDAALSLLDRLTLPAACCLLLGAALLAAHPARAQEAAPWTVSGVVVAADGAPLPGVEVAAGEQRTRTNGQGRFTLRMAQPGPATLVFRLPGYRPLEKSIDSATSAVIVSMQPLQ